MTWEEVYNFFRDQGSILSGILAVWVGWVVVVATRKAAKDQVVAMREQLARAAADSAERDSREIINALRLISIETARLKLMAEHRRALVIDESVPGKSQWVKQPADVFRIFTTGVLRDAAGATALLDPVLLERMTGLVASVDHMNSTIETKLPVGTLTCAELKEDFERINECANNVQAQLGIFEDRRRAGQAA